MLNSLLEIVLCVSLTSIQLNDQLGCCSRWKTLINRLSMLLWTLLRIYLLVHVGMMLSLVSLIVFHVFVDLYHIVVVCQRLIVHSCSGNTGFVDLECL